MLRVKKAFAAAAALLFLAGCAGETAENAGDIFTGGVNTEKNYDTYVVKTEDIYEDSTINLKPVYTQEQTLYAPGDRLYLYEIAVQRGDEVKQGGVIARFTMENSPAELEKLKLRLERAKEDKEDRLEDLQEAVDMAAYSGGAQLELARLNYDRAEYEMDRNIASLEKEVEELEETFEFIELTAPYDCVIDALKYITPRQKVDSSTEVVDIFRASSLVLGGQENRNNFRYGSEVEIEYGKKNERKTMRGRVISTSALLESDEGLVGILPLEPVSGGELLNPVARTDMLQMKDALTVPHSAVTTEGGKSYVQVVSDGVLYKRYIICGLSLGSGKDDPVVVLSGVKAGQTVVLK